jgi:ABC-2 type transport system permease protein
MKTALDIVLKDLRSSFRSRFAIGIMFVLPLVLSGLIYLAFGRFRVENRDATVFAAKTGGVPIFKASLPVIKVGLVNLDQAGSTGLGAILVHSLQSEGLAGLVQARELSDEPSARSALDRQELGVVVLIPYDFTAAAMRPEGQATVRLVSDPTLTLGPRIVEGVVQQILDGLENRDATVFAAKTGGVHRKIGTLPFSPRKPVVSLFSGVQVRAPAAGPAPAQVFRVVFGRIMAGMMIFFVFYSGATVAMTMLKEDEEGTLGRLFTTATSRRAIIGGKFLSVFATAVVQSGVLLAVSALLFGINWGRPVTVAMAVLGLDLSAAALGILLMSFVRNARQSGTVVGGVLSVTGMLGGLFTAAVPNMPDGFNRLALVTPQGWALKSWTLALAGRAPREGLLVLVILLAIGVVCLSLGTLRIRKRFA